MRLDLEQMVQNFTKSYNGMILIWRKANHKLHFETKLFQVSFLVVYTFFYFITFITQKGVLVHPSNDSEEVIKLPKMVKDKLIKVFGQSTFVDIGKYEKSPHIQIFKLFKCSIITNLELNFGLKQKYRAVMMI